MRQVLAISFLFLLSNSGIAQELSIGFGLYSEQSSGSSGLDLDSVFVLEDNRYISGRLGAIHVSFHYKVKPNLKLGLALQYRVSYFDLSAYALFDHPLGPVGKGTVVGVDNIEIPITGNLILNPKARAQVRVIAGITPVFGIVNSKTDYEADPTTLDWTQPVADALNAAASIPSRRHINYQCGLGASYKRFDLTCSIYGNLTRNIANDYEIWGQSFGFRRTIRGAQLIFSYKIIDKGRPKDFHKQ
ncbi:MAG: hypothetical protein AAF519_07940 [Bacteroidota bacterium]